jgi:vacuole morphology and inheritance protein 14
MSSEILPVALERGLGDKSYEKRKNSAVEITALIKAFQEKGENDKIATLIQRISKDFILSKNSNYRKGGLIGLAAVAIGLVTDINKFLHLLIPSVLQCFDDQESRVCYYACESMYNLVKVAMTDILNHFNPIFDGICNLFDHADTDVRNGAILLDKLIRDIVIESQKIDIDGVIPLLKNQIGRTKPHIRQLLLGWIMVLKSIPNTHMLDFLPDFLAGLIDMLNDPAREIREAAENALTSFLHDIRDADVVDFGPMIKILVKECCDIHDKSSNIANKKISLSWLMEFCIIGEEQLVLYYADVLQCVMKCISDDDSNIVSLANSANDILRKLVLKSKNDTFPLKNMLATLNTEVMNTNIQTRIASLDWLSMLYDKNSDEMNNNISMMLPILLQTLSDTSDEVMLVTLEVLARVCLFKEQYNYVIKSLVQLFMDDRELLETRGSLIIRKLVGLLNYKIYLTMAEISNESDDLQFCSIFVQSLNLILLTAPELHEFREKLKNCFNSNSNTEDRDDFNKIYICWCHNAVATFSLCLMAQAYDLSARLIHKFAAVEISVSLLMQIDKLVQLLESPIFVHLRLQLLETNANKHQDLLKSLYGLLMLLPQSQAYKMLSDRLRTVSALQMHLNGAGGNSASNVVKPSKSDEKKNELIERFHMIQTRHSEVYAEEISGQSLLKYENKINILKNDDDGGGPS